MGHGNLARRDPDERADSFYRFSVRCDHASTGRLSVPAFVDGDAVRIPARLRYRVASGKVMWFYQLYRWEFFLREQVENDLAAVAKATSLPAFEGAPEQ